MNKGGAMYADTEPLPVPLRKRDLTPEEERDRLASMARHPAGKKRLSQCPTCGQNASGALGDPTYAV